MSAPGMGMSPAVQALLQKHHALVWRPSGLGDALSLLARKLGIIPRDAGISGGAEGDVVDPFELMEDAAERLDLEIEPIRVPYPELDETLRSLGAAIVRVANGQGYIAVLRVTKRAMKVLTPDGSTRSLPTSEVRALLVGDIETAPSQRVAKMLAALELPANGAARTALVDNLLAHVVVEGVWILRAPTSRPLSTLVTMVRAWQSLAIFVGALVFQAALAIVSWAVMGRMTLGGQVDPGWLVGWALLCLTTIPVDVVATWTIGRLSIELGSVLKQRLLLGAARIASGSRVAGTTKLFSTVIEAEVLEGNVLQSALLALAAIVELATATAILSVGAAGTTHTILLLGWLVFTAVTATRLYRARTTWTKQRLGLTARFVEAVMGHRTRRAQEPIERRHEGEDLELDAYLDASSQADRWQHRLAAFPTRGWLLVALLGLIPAMLSPATQPLALAISVAGILQAQRSFGKVAQVGVSIMNVLQSWRSVGPLFQAAAQREPASRLEPGADKAAHPRAPALLMRGVSFKYAPDAAPALTQCSLAIPTGARVLIEGESGGGKSTMAGILAGLRDPNEGFLLAHGLDRTTLGARGWRRRVAYAPQFHENHVFTGTLAFNVLMGKAWPPRRVDVERAETILRELDLGPLLDRMPSGMNQVIGDTGWQLSHGERSRLFLARALIQSADVVILDESFAALDPVTQKSAVKVAARHAKTLVVIAHP